MASWKENKMVGVVAGILAVVFITLAIIGIINKVMPHRPSGPVPLVELEE